MRCIDRQYQHELVWRSRIRVFTAYVEFDPETELHAGIVPGAPGAHTQACSPDKLREDLKEVLELCLEELGQQGESLPRFAGRQQIEVGA